MRFTLGSLLCRLAAHSWEELPFDESDVRGCRRCRRCGRVEVAELDHSGWGEIVWTPVRRGRNLVEPSRPGRPAD